MNRCLGIDIPSKTLLTVAARRIFTVTTGASRCPLFTMAPKQATLGKFFGQAGDSKPAPTQTQQTKLSFATKATRKAKEQPDDASSSNGNAQNAQLPKAKAESDVKETARSKKDAKKRSRSSQSPEPSVIQSPTRAKAEESEADVEKDEEEETPAMKRRRRARKRVESEEDEVIPDAEPVKAKKTATKEASKKSSATAAASKKKKAPKVEENEDDEDEPMPDVDPKVASKKPSVVATTASKRKKALEAEEDDETGDKSTSESASEVEGSDEDEKPAISAKAREKIQKQLKTSAQCPYPDWEAGTPVPYAALCTTFSLIELTTKRLAITAHCALFLRQVLRLTPEDFLPTVLLMINKLAPDYAGIELGIGESLIMKAIGESTGRSLQIIKADQKEIGDLGLVAVKSRSTQPTMFKPKALTVRGVHEGLMDVATTAGNGSQGRKVDLIKKMLSSADSHSTRRVDISKDKGGPSEAKYLVRFLEGKLRLGLAEKTVLVSIAQAVISHEMEQKGKGKGKDPTTEQIEKAEALLKSVYSEMPSWNVIIPAMLKDGIMNLKETCKLRPGVPLKPMLAKPTKAITEVLDRFENQTFTCEYKYDGERAQIHYVAKERADDFIEALPGATTEAAKGVASIFSRNSEDLSKKYPDILAKLDTWIKEGTKSFVLDCETVGWDVTEKKVLPFQQLMTRKKKDVKVEDVKVKVCVFAFDLLFLNGEAVVEKSLRERRVLLQNAFQPVEGEFAFATHMNGQELEEIQVFLDESVKNSCEGLMVKMLDGSESGYEPSKRSRNWLKIKKDYLSGVGDSLDLVVVGAYYGKGKRTSVYGAFLLACRNAASDSYETICNIGTGFSEQALEELHGQLSKIVIDRPKPFYSHSTVNPHQPDVWFEPRYVWEVKTADLTLSPRYKAGCKEGVDPSGDKGISLRFPRFIKLREDKKPNQATSSRQVAEMYWKQESVTKGPSVDDDFEY